MVKARLCETARLAFFLASLRHFDFLNSKIETLKCFKCERETFKLLKLKFEYEQVSLSWYELVQKSYKRVLWNSDNLRLILISWKFENCVIITLYHVTRLQTSVIHLNKQTIMDFQTSSALQKIETARHNRQKNETARLVKFG